MVINNEVNENEEVIFYLIPSEMCNSGLLNLEKVDSCDIKTVEVNDI